MTAVDEPLFSFTLEFRADIYHIYYYKIW